ncbi:hypothetical protein BHE74_00018383 [Ensete ventricosum]|nr:hypothetical protein BHE74_00018383 [Ensete ventricosum]
MDHFSSDALVNLSSSLQFFLVIGFVRLSSLFDSCVLLSFRLIYVWVGFGSRAQGSRSLTLGERLCALFIPFIAAAEAFVFVFAAPAAFPPTVTEVVALYELYKKLSNSIINDDLIHKEEIQLALFHTRTGENLFLDRLHSDYMIVNKLGLLSKRK